MQYTHKDTYNNQTLPHPTTPLGTLTHKTPPQHTLAGNPWTTSDLRVMSIVLGLLDTPLYLLIYHLRLPTDISNCTRSIPYVSFIKVLVNLLWQMNLFHIWQWLRVGNSLH